MDVEIFLVRRKTTNWATKPFRGGHRSNVDEDLVYSYLSKLLAHTAMATRSTYLFRNLLLDFLSTVLLRHQRFYLLRLFSWPLEFVTTTLSGVNQVKAALRNSNVQLRDHRESGKQPSRRFTSLSSVLHRYCFCFLAAIFVVIFFLVLFLCLFRWWCTLPVGLFAQSQQHQIQY